MSNFVEPWEARVMASLQPSARPYDSVCAAAAALLRALATDLPYRLWVIARFVGDHWVPIYVTETDAGISTDERRLFEETCCFHMVQGKAPMFVPNLAEYEVYAHSHLAKDLVANSYVGVPLNAPDGTLIGTLSAYAVSAQRPLTENERCRVLETARVLSTLIHFRRENIAARRPTDFAHDAQYRDTATGLLNHRAWVKLLDEEEDFLASHAEDGAVLSVRLLGLTEMKYALGLAAADALLKQAATTLKENLLRTDHVARLADDELVALLPGVVAPPVGSILERIETRLRRAGVAAVVGMCRRKEAGTLQHAHARVRRLLAAGENNHSLPLI